MWALASFAMSIGLVVAAVGWWRYIVAFNMRVRFGYDNYGNREVPRSFRFTQYVGTIFLGAMGVVLFCSVVIELVKLLS